MNTLYIGKLNVSFQLKLIKANFARKVITKEVLHVNLIQ